MLGSTPSTHSFGKALARAATGGSHAHSNNSNSDHNKRSVKAARWESKGSKLPPTDKASISRRLQHARAAVLCENVRVGDGGGHIPNGAEYALIPHRWSDPPMRAVASPEPSAAINVSGTAPARGKPPTEDGTSGVTSAEAIREQEERFAIVLQLHQNDVAALCIWAGVLVATLWSAEALLLNVNSHREHLMNDGRGAVGVAPV